MFKIPFFKTYINKSANNKVNLILKSTFLNEGHVVDEFEKRPYSWLVYK